MKPIMSKLVAAVMAVTFMATGCASSYQDRLDALNEEQPAPSVPETPVAPDSNVLSRDDIPLSGACIVNADCANTQYCSLGRCTQDCSADKPCDGGLYCSKRGKCVADAKYVDADPVITVTAPPEWITDKRVVRLDAGQNSSSFAIQVVSGGSLTYRIQVEPETMRNAVTVTHAEGTVGSGGTGEVTVTVDRNAFGAGDHRVAVNVVSDAGQRAVMFEFSNGLNGRYGGFIDYQEPGLGRVPFVMDLTVDETGKALGRIVTNGSLLFSQERTLRGQYHAENQTINLHTADLVEAGTQYDPFGRNIHRDINIAAEVNEQGVLQGDLEETITGLLANPTTVTGEIHVTRVTKEVDPIVALTDPVVTTFPSLNTNYQALTELNAECGTELQFRSNMIACSTNMRPLAFKLGVNFSTTDAQNEPIVNFRLVSDCQKDIAAPNTSNKACVNIDAMNRLIGDQQHYLLHSNAQETEYAQYVEDLKSLVRLYAFMGNDKLVSAYRTSVEEVDKPLTTEIARIDDALDLYIKAEQLFFGAVNVATLKKAPASTITAGEYDVLRAPLEFIGASQSALQRLVSLSLRRYLGREDKKPELRALTQQNARAVFLEGVALAELVKASGGSFKSELAQIADELRGIGRLTATLEGGLNPLGFTGDYVPFIYDPADSAHTTNFAQLLTAATDIVGSAVNKGESANAQVEQMQVRTEDIAQKMQQIQDSYESEIEHICGINSLTLLGECGQTSGELALVYNDIALQYKAIEDGDQQIFDLNEMVKIKRDTALQIQGIKAKTLMLIQMNGAQMESLEMASAEIQAALIRKSSILGAIGGFISGGLQILGGVGAMFPGGTGVEVDPSQGSGGFAGGVGTMVNAGLGMAMGSYSAEAELAKGRIQRQKSHLQTMQQVRIQEEGMEVDAVRAAEEVKLLLLKMAELNLQQEMANLRLTQHVIRATNMLERVDYLTHQRDVLMSQQLRSVQNPLSNLSYRIRRDNAVLLAMNQFDKAMDRVYLAARGLEHELNVELPEIESKLFQANSSTQLADFKDCLAAWNDDYRLAYGSSHEEVTQVSLREDILGFTQPVFDEVAQREVSPQELFRRVLLNPNNITTTGAVEYPFTTSVAGGDLVFSTLVCNDRIKRIRVMLQGDALGDNEASVILRQEGDSTQRDCSANPSNNDDRLVTYSLDRRKALIQAGVNSFGIAQPNAELAGRSVASNRWVLVIPTGKQAPNNADVDVTKLDDVVIEITHEARTLTDKPPTSVFSQCNI